MYNPTHIIVEIRGLHLTRADNKKTTAGHISSSMRSMAKRKLEFMGTECLLECHYMSVVDPNTELFGQVGSESLSSLLQLAIPSS